MMVAFSEEKDSDPLIHPTSKSWTAHLAGRVGIASPDTTRYVVRRKRRWIMNLQLDFVNGHILSCCEVCDPFFSPFGERKQIHGQLFTR